MHKVYIIILNYQSFEDTIKYVQLLQNQNSIDLNILVVDNDSPNSSFTFLKEAFTGINNVEVIKSERNGGYAYGNNFGLRYIKDKELDFIVISNNDILIDDDHLIYKLTIEYAKLENPAFIAPIMKNNGEIAKNSGWKIPSLKDDIYSTLRFSRLFIKDNIFYKLDNKSDIKVDCLPGSFFLSKKSIFYDIGLFDEATFLYGEERILAYKIKKIGLKNYLIQKLSYVHYESKTISKEIISYKMLQYLFESRFYFHATYMSLSKYKLYFYKFIFILSYIEQFLVNLMKYILRK